MNAGLMHAATNLLQDPPKPEQYTPVVDKPTVAAREWRDTAMSAATFTLSALVGYIATEAISKSIRGRN